MDIVIKLPDKDYSVMLTKIMLACHGCKIIELPTGHGRLIDADETISKICGSSCGCHLEECGNDKPCFSVARIESAPTIIEADRSEEE